MYGSVSTKEKAKKTPRDFLYKLADSFHVKKPEPKLPLLSSQSSPSQIPTVPEDINAMFRNLSVSSSPEYDRTSSVVPFVGGFKPIGPGNQYKVDRDPVNFMSTPNFPIPLEMPSPCPRRPQSLTLQMAFRSEQSVHRPNRLHSDPLPSSLSADEIRPLAPVPLDSYSSSTNVIPTSHTSPSAAISFDKFTVSSSSSRKTRNVQCSGITKAGRRCNRKVKAETPILISAVEERDESSQQFCYQHTKELLMPSGFYARKNREWVKFEDWIPSYLQPETQVSLRVEMDKARSQSDVPGYIYTFEIREEHEKETIKLKVGRAVNLVKRIDEWGKQCGSKEQSLIGFYPNVGSGENGKEISLMKGRVRAGEKALWCHRLERLVHIELRDLSVSSIYLNPDWPNVEPVIGSNFKDRSISMSAISCPDCGSMHREIFEFRRWKRGGNQGKEWERLVKPVIERWGAFVELYV